MDNGQEKGASKDNEDDSSGDDNHPAEIQPFKKRRLVVESVMTEEKFPEPSEAQDMDVPSTQEPTTELASSNVIIHDED